MECRVAQFRGDCHHGGGTARRICRHGRASGRALMQPWEFVIIIGTALGTFIVANPWKVVVDTGLACMQAITRRGAEGARLSRSARGLHALMRELRGKGRNEVEAHIDDPSSSEIFKAFPERARGAALLQFICDYVRLIIMGNARTHEIEALMDEEIQTIVRSKLTPYHALAMVVGGACRRSGSSPRCSASSRRWARSTSRRSCSAASSARRWSAPSPASSCPTASFRPSPSRSK